MYNNHYSVVGKFYFWYLQAYYVNSFIFLKYAMIFSNLLIEFGCFNCFVSGPTINSFCEGEQCRALWESQVSMACSCRPLWAIEKKENEGACSTDSTDNILRGVIYILLWLFGGFRRFFWLLSPDFFYNVFGSLDWANTGMVLYWNKRSFLPPTLFICIVFVSIFCK